MPSVCAVADCRNNSTNNRNLSYHRFPLKEEALCSKWVEFCGRRDKFKIRTSLICSAHFEEEDFERDLYNELPGHSSRIRLKKDAFPTRRAAAVIFVADDKDDSIPVCGGDREDEIKSRKLSFETNITTKYLSTALNLNTKDICFLCLTKTAGVTDKGEDEDEGQNNYVWNLRNLSRFLRINLNEKISKALEQSAEDQTVEWSDVKVHLCGGCRALALRFGELYEALEVTKLRLNGCIERINEVLVTSEKDERRVEEAKETLLGTTGVKEESEGAVRENVTFKVMSLLRSEVLERVSIRVQGDPPRVILKKLAPPRPEPEPEKVVEAIQEEPPKEPEVTENSDNNDDDSVIVLNSDSEEEPVPKLIPNAKVVPTKTRFMRTRVCRFCSHKITGYHGSLLAERHEVKFHCHELLEHLRIPEVGQDLFCRIVNHVLFKNIKLKKETVTSEGEEKQFVVCPHCPKVLGGRRTGKAGTLMKLHLLQEHSATLGKRLKALQDKLKQKQMKGREEVEVGMGSQEERERSKFTGFTCVCGCYLASSKTAAYHEAQFQCQSKKQVELEEGQVKPRETEVVPPIKVTPPIIVSKTVKARFLKCRFCSNPISRRFIGVHEVKFHCHELLKDHRIQEVGADVFCKIVHHLLFKNIKKTWGGAEEEQEEGEYGEKVTCRCPYCDKEFWSRNKRWSHHQVQHMRIHLIRMHLKEVVTLLKELQRDLAESQRRLELEKAKETYSGSTCSCGCYFALEASAKWHETQFHCKKKERTSHAPAQASLSPPTSGSVSGSRRKQFSSGGGGSSRRKSTFEVVRTEEGPSGSELIVTKCSQCKACFKEVGSAESLKNHMVQFHLHLFFPRDLREKKLDCTDYKIILYHVLFASLDGFTLDEDDLGGSCLIPCLHCNQAFEYRRESGQFCPQLRLHLIQEHRKDLLESLKALQKDPNVKSSFKKLRKVGKKCAHCRDYLATKQLYKTHVDEYCKVRKPPKTLKQCLSCGELLPSESLSDHQCGTEGQTGGNDSTGTTTAVSENFQVLTPTSDVDCQDPLAGFGYLEEPEDSEHEEEECRDRDEKVITLEYDDDNHCYDGDKSEQQIKEKVVLGLGSPEKKLHSSGHDYGKGEGASPKKRIKIEV